MWPFTAPKVEPKPDALSTDERIKALETKLDTLQMDWEDVLSKISRRAARDASRIKADLSRQLEAEPPNVVPGAFGTAAPATDEYSGPPGVGMLRGPSKEQLRARLRRA